ncbi:EpsG family protein [Vibrio breoganii]|uniref:EpsG family protein n=1 Tax=Vibrio breoganii TaxID=553239 RepID=UPI000C862213|nr:EpsG family protein [Vibrio breoganii]PMM19868.1 hypothetical protein BCT59_08755 [Vibrio breoganii]
MSGYMVVASYLVAQVLSIFSLFFKKKTERVILFVPLILLWYLASSKSEFSSYDMENYFDFFKNAPTLSEYDVRFYYGFEPLFVLYNSVIKSLGLGFTAFNTIIATLVLGIYAYLFRIETPKPLIALIVYIGFTFYKTELITIRFGLALSILMFSFYLYRVKQVFWSFILFLCSTQIHYSALTGVFFYVASLISFTNRRIILFIMVSCFFSIFNPFLIVVNIMETVGIPGYGRILKHLNSGEEAASMKRLLIYLPVFLFSITHRRGLKQYFSSFENIFKMLVVGICLSLTFTQSTTLSRVSEVYLFSLVWLVPYMYVYSKKNKLFMWYYISLAYVILYPLYMFLRYVFFNSGGSVVLTW